MEFDYKSVSGGSSEAANLFVEGLGTSTYLTMRGKEECYRVKRYGRPLSLVRLRLDNPDPATERRLQNWLRSDVRASDVPAYLGEANYAVLLPEVDARNAAHMMNRMAAQFPRLRSACSSCPQDGESWEKLLASAEHKLGGSSTEQDHVNHAV